MKRILVLVAAALLLAAACTTGTEIATETVGTPTPEESPSAEETPEPTPEETPEPTPEETPEPTPEETPEPTPEETPEPTPEETPEPTPEPTSTSEGNGADSEFCQTVQQMEDAPNPFDTEAGATLDPAALEASIDEALAMSERARELAPPELHDDIDTVLEGQQEIRDVFAAADYDFLDVRLRDLLAIVNNQAFFEAQQRLDIAGEELCGIPADLEEFEEASLDDFGGAETIRESMIEQFTQLGIDAEGATCMAAGLTMEMLAGTFEEILDLAIGCGVDPTTLN